MVGRVHEARAPRRGCALASRDSGRLRMRHGAGQAPECAQSPGDARLKVLGPETPDVGARLRGHAGSREAREEWGRRVRTQRNAMAQPAASSPPTFGDFFLYAGCIWVRERRNSGQPFQVVQKTSKEVTRHGTTQSWNRPLALNLNVTGGLMSGKGIF